RPRRTAGHDRPAAGAPARALRAPPGPARGARAARLRGPVARRHAPDARQPVAHGAELPARAPQGDGTGRLRRCPRGRAGGVTVRIDDLLSRALREGAAAAPPSDADDRILDAALAEFAAYGTARATMEDVGRRAGVSRITVFRRFGSKDALVERLLRRELERVLAAVERRFDAVHDPAERIVEAFVACVRAGAEHPLVARMARVEAGVAFERLFRGDPAPADLGRAFVARHLRADLPRKRA